MTEYAVTFSVPQLDFKKNLILGTQVTLSEIEGYFRKQMDLPEVLEFHTEPDFTDPPLPKTKTVAGVFYNFNENPNANMIYLHLDYNLGSGAQEPPSRDSASDNYASRKEQAKEPVKPRKENPLDSQHESPNSSRRNSEVHKNGHVDSNKSSPSNSDANRAASFHVANQTNSRSNEPLPQIVLNNKQTLFSPPKADQNSAISQPNTYSRSYSQKEFQNDSVLSLFGLAAMTQEPKVLRTQDSLQSTAEKRQKKKDKEKEKEKLTDTQPEDEERAEKKKKKKDKEKEKEKLKEKEEIETTQPDDEDEKAEKKKKKKKDKKKEDDEGLPSPASTDKRKSADNKSLDEVKKKLKLSKKASIDTESSKLTEITMEKKSSKKEKSVPRSDREPEMKEEEEIIFDELDGKKFVTILNSYQATNHHFNVNPKIQVNELIEAYKQRTGLLDVSVWLADYEKSKVYNKDDTLTKIFTGDEFTFQVVIAELEQ